MPFHARCNPASLIPRRNAFIALQRARRGAISTIPSTTTVGLPSCPPRQHQLQIRHNSTTSLLSPITSFFSRARRPAQSTTSASAIDEYVLLISSPSLSAEDVQRLSSAYSTIINDVTVAPSGLITTEQRLGALRLLAKSASSSNAVTLLRRLYEDLAIEKQQEEGVQKLMLEALVVAGLPADAFDFARSTEDWRSILRSAVEHDPSLVDEVIPELRGTLTSEDYSLLIRNLKHYRRDKAVLSKRLEALLGDIETGGIQLDWSTQAELMRLHLVLGQIDKADTIVNGWEGKAVSSPGLWNAMIELEIAKEDSEGLERTIVAMRDAGYETPQKAIAFLAIRQLRQSISSRSSVGYNEIVSALESAEKLAGGTVAKSDVWAQVIRTYLNEVKQHDALDVALEVYEESKMRELEVTLDLARNMIIPLCNSRQQPQRLGDAMRIYDDYMATTVDVPLSSSSSSKRTRFASVYQYLLVSCARAQPPAVTTAIRLLSDMRRQSLDFTSTNLTSLLILLMRSSPDHHSAFNVYAHFYALNPSTIDERGFDAILTSYLNLHWDHSPFAPPELFVAMMKDMHRAGYDPGSRILSALLKQYGLLATKLRRRLRSGQAYTATTSMGEDLERDMEAGTAIATIPNPNTTTTEDYIDALAQAIRDIHNLIKLEPLIHPDIPLLTSLMDAYSRVGAFSETFEVWDELVQRRNREPSGVNIKQSYAAGINVILDTCGWSYSLSRGRKAWAWAKRWGLVWEKRQYDAWVECLLRNGEMDEATNVVLDEMGGQSGGSNSPQADKDTVRLLIKFGRKELARGKRDQVERNWSRVKERLPEWWEELNKAR
ncbi:hypothetical protein CI109_102771 [Kwoniella shandongensis]|uniref:Pentatricopeptide repeat domain-containing protein n=1 Tax=Kwoniella shandongensis TaxID=1734106 RepID=A0AAJ8LJB8_9TREE